jgi:outer membrane autotransporter protein
MAGTTPSGGSPSPASSPSLRPTTTSPSQLLVNGRFRAEYLLSNGSWYAKPLVDLDVTHIDLDGASESGSGGMALKVNGSGQTVFSATPMVELGTQYGNPNGTLYRPYIRGGATFFDDADFAVLASFEGAPSGVGSFRIATSTDDVVGNVGVGLDVIGVEGASFRLYYEGRFGDTVADHAGGIKGSWPF